MKKTLVIVWVLGRLKKISKNTFFVLNIYQSVTHVSTCIFKNIVFRSVALVTKQLLAISVFDIPDFFCP